MTIAISNNIIQTKQLFTGDTTGGVVNMFYGSNFADLVEFSTAATASYKVPNITTGDVFILKGIDATTVKAKIIGNSVVLTAGSQTYTFGAIAGGESFTVKFDDGKELAIVRTDDNSGLTITSKYSTDSPITLTSSNLSVAPVIPEFVLTTDSMGASSSDGISNDDTITVNGLKVGASWKYTLDNGSSWSLPSTASSTSSTFSLGVSATQTFDAGKIKVQQTYNNGTETTTSLANPAAIVIDKTAPAVASSNPIVAATNKITLTFSEPVSTSLLIGDISANNGLSLGSATLAAVSAVGGYATSFEITRDVAATIATGDTLTVTSAKAVDKAGNNNSAAITFAVPTLPDIKPPTMKGAEVLSSGSMVVITYSEVLSGSPEASDYAITLSSGTTTVSNALINTNTNTVMLTLTSAIGVGVTVSEIAYNATNGTTNSIKDVATNSAFTQNLTSGIINNSTADITPPVLVSAVVPINAASTVVLTYGEALDGTNVPVVGDFTVKVNGSPDTVNSLAVDSSAKTVTLTLASAVTNGQTVTVDYVQDSDVTKRIQDATGNDSLALTAQAVSNETIAPDTTPPVFASAAVNGTSLVLTYTDVNNLDATNKPATTDFVVKVGTTTATVNSVAVNAKTVTLTLNSAVLNSDTVTIAYTDPTANNDTNAIQDVAGNDAITLPTRSVTNNTPDITPPTATITQADFYEDTRTITLTGTNFNTLLQPDETLGVTDIKTRLDWSKFVWDINNDNSSTADVTFAVGDITSAIVGTNDTELSIVLGSTKATALYGTMGFNTSSTDSSVDGLTVYAGFLKDGASTPNVNQVNTLTLLGSNFASLLTAGEVNNGDSIVDAKARIDWTKLTWDTNKDNTVTADVTFSDTDISSATLDTNTGKLDIVFTQSKIDALYQATGFNKSSVDAITDGLIITSGASGFFKNATPTVTSAYLNSFDTALNSTNYDATVLNSGSFNSAVHSTNLAILGSGTFSIVGTSFSASPVSISLKDGSSAIIQANVSALPNNAAVTNGSTAPGKMSVDLTGTTGANITLGTGGDTVILGENAQSVSMGSGADVLVINKSSATASLESDFAGGGADKIYISKGSSTFTLNTAADNVLNSTDFGTVIKYNAGVLEYDADGSDGNAAVTILTLTAAPTLTAADFYVIA